MRKEFEESLKRNTVAAWERTMSDVVQRAREVGLTEQEAELKMTHAERINDRLNGDEIIVTDVMSDLVEDSWLYFESYMADVISVEGDEEDAEDDYFNEECWKVIGKAFEDVVWAKYQKIDRLAKDLKEVLMTAIENNVVEFVNDEGIEDEEEVGGVIDLAKLAVAEVWNSTIS